MKKLLAGFLFLGLIGSGIVFLINKLFQGRLKKT